MYGTSMVVSGGHGLGEAQDTGIDWNKMFSDALKTGTDIWSSTQTQKQIAAQREFELQMAKITGGAAAATASSGGSGVKTQDGMKPDNTKLYIGLAAGAAVLLGGFYLLSKKRR